MVSGGYDLGVAYDGDGDRAIFVDDDGRIVDGDAVMLMCAKRMKREGRLDGNAVVATVMSNIGLEKALRDEGITMFRCAVGDKYVMEEMLARKLSLGGEQSGHVIFSEYLFTGDGLATSLHVLRTIGATGRRLSDLASDLTSYPQVLVNVPVKRKVDLSTVSTVAAVMSDVEARLAGNGRLLVRYSRHRAAAARDDRGTRSSRDREVGGRDCHGGQTASVMHESQFTIQKTSISCPRDGVCILHVAFCISMINLSVNVNKIATLRNSRGGATPSVIDAVKVC